MLEKMGALGSWLESLAATLLPVLMEMTQDRQWRVRKAIVGVIPLFVEHLVMNRCIGYALHCLFSYFA